MSHEEDLNTKAIDLDKTAENMRKDYDTDLRKGVIKPNLNTAAELVMIASTLLQRARSIIL